MKLYANVKQAGSRKNYITKEEINLNLVPTTLREVIGAMVTENVNQFNDKIKNQKLVDYLSSEEINNKLTVGKVSFGELHNTTKAGINKALECAFLAYEDGIYRVFINDNEAGGLDEAVELKEEDVLTFIRLAMLSGRMW
jgi:hypothetical protein